MDKQMKRLVILRRSELKLPNVITGLATCILLATPLTAQTTATTAAPVYTPDGRLDPSARYADLTVTNNYDPTPDGLIPIGEDAFAGNYPGDVYPQQKLDGVPRRREGFFQGVEVSEGFLPGDGDEDLGLNEVMAWFSVGIPFPDIQSPLVISPTFGVTILDGPNTAPLPSQLYRNSVDVQWMPTVGNWKFFIAATPGYYSDYEASRDDAVRVPGRLLAQRTFFDGTLDIIGGVVYLNREDIDFLPAIGLRYRPTADWDLAVIFPRPKLAYRLRWDGVREDWIYLGGEFGGNTWAVQTPGVGDDLLTLSDLRLKLGWERRAMGGFGIGAEIAYVFDRSYELESAGGDVDLQDSVMVSGMLRY
jgi:hypothetical protein